MTIDFAALKAPIPASLIKQRPGRGSGKFSYITSRVVMDRLDTVCGPENWRDEYAPSLAGDGVQCTIYIRVDGEWIGKSDVGSESNIEEEKGAYSDALKRAAVKWGIARELYGDTPAPRKAAPKRAPQNAGGGKGNSPAETIEDVVLLSARTWGGIHRRLVDAKLANHEKHAFNRLKKIVEKELGEGNTIQRAEDAGWTEADVIAKFKTRIAEKDHEEYNGAVRDFVAGFDE
jgi:hypothetical protein